MKEKASQKKGRIVFPKVAPKEIPVKEIVVEKIPVEQKLNVPLKTPQVYPQLIKTLQIKEGNNVFEVVLNKMANRSYQIKILFNGNEIRPATYTGMSPALNYWNLLNGSKK